MLIRGKLANQTALHHFEIDFITIIIVYLLIHYGMTGAGLLALSQGILIDIFSAGLLGLFTFLYLMVFLGINFGLRFFDMNSPRSIMILASLGVVFKGVLFLVLLDLFSIEFTVTSNGLLMLAASALGTGLLAPVLFYVLNHIGRSFMKVNGEAT